MHSFKKDLCGAVRKTIDSAINLGKSAIGIVTGKFETIEQAEDAVKKGGLLDSLSKVLDTTLDKIENKNLINNEMVQLIKLGKDAILNNLETNIEKNFSDQIKTVENINTNIKSWQEAYNKNDFENMEKQYKKIQAELKQVLPLENVLIKARQLENIHNLIKNNGKNFNLSEEQLSLAERLI